MVAFSKTERHTLRELAPLVYEAEARQFLAPLDTAFHRWRARKIGSSELIEKIHEFHQHDARDLLSIYRSLRRDEIVARGVAFELIQAQQVPAELTVKLRYLVDHYRAAAMEADRLGPGNDEDEHE